MGRRERHGDLDAILWSLFLRSLLLLPEDGLQQRLGGPHRAPAQRLHEGGIRLRRCVRHGPLRHRPGDLAREHGRAELRQRGQGLRHADPVADDLRRDAEPLAGVVAQGAEAERLVAAALHEREREHSQHGPHGATIGDERLDAGVDVAAAQEEQRDRGRRRSGRRREASGSGREQGLGHPRTAGDRRDDTKESMAWRIARQEGARALS